MTNRETAKEIVNTYIKYNHTDEELVNLIEQALDRGEIKAYLNGFNTGKKEPKGVFSPFPDGMVEEVIRLGNRKNK